MQRLRKKIKFAKKKRNCHIQEDREQNLQKEGFELFNYLNTDKGTYIKVLIMTL